MDGKVIKIEDDPNIGEVLGAKIGNNIFPIPYREGDIRMLKPGDGITFITTREGAAEIISPKPVIGCEREK